MISSASFISVDLVEEFATPTGLAFLVRAKTLQGAEFRPLAVIHRREGRLAAEVFFERPIGPERQESLVVGLRLTGGGA